MSRFRISDLGLRTPESGIAEGKLFEELLVEADELVDIFITLGKKSK